MKEKHKILNRAEEERELKEIIEIAQLAKASKEAAQPYEDKSRPIIESKDYGQEIKVIHFMSH